MSSRIAPLLSKGTPPTSSFLLAPRTQNWRQSHSFSISSKKQAQLSLNICRQTTPFPSAYKEIDVSATTRVAAMMTDHSPVEKTTCVAAMMTDRSPVLLFDVMGTIVRDPFYQDIPAFFGISLKELLQIKHPTAWIDFEKGLITEEELVHNFFKDKRSFDAKGLKTCVANGYEYLEGVELLLNRLKSKGYQMHAFTNYPLWYNLIEQKLELSKYLTWTFVSCHTGKRKPDPEAFLHAAKQLGQSPSDIIFIDDQSINVEAAIQTGMIGLTFQGSEKLENDLKTLGISL